MDRRRRCRNAKDDVACAAGNAITKPTSSLKDQTLDQLEFESDDADRAHALFPDCPTGFWSWMRHTDSGQAADADAVAATRMRVVVPMRDAAATIGAALLSVNASAATLWAATAAGGGGRGRAVEVEAVVVDDASSDGGAAAVRAFADACAAGAS
jgi:hypothetical protein